MKPFFSIWISPLKTFEYLSQRDDSRNSLMIDILSVLISIGMIIPRLQGFSELFGDQKIIGFIIGIILYGAFGYFTIKVLWTLVFWVIGKILKGKATKSQVQLVVVYSHLPFLIYLAISMVLIIVALITKNFYLIFYQHPVTHIIVVILIMRNLVYGLSFVNKFSYGFALLTTIIPLGITELIYMIITNLKN